MTTSQNRASERYRKRLKERGMARFEVLALDADRGLIRELARRLAQADRGAAQLRSTLSNTVATSQVRKGGVFAALRRSPLVGADLEVTRPVVLGRDVDL